MYTLCYVRSIQLIQKKVILVNSILIISVILIIIIGIFFIINKFRLKKKEQGVSAILLTIGSSLVVGSFGDVWSNINQTITTVFLSESVDEVIETNSAFSQTNWVQLITGILLMGVGGYLAYFVKNKLFILNINAYFDKRIEPSNKDLGLSTFEFKEREIDLIKIYKKNQIKDSYKEVLEIIEDKTTSFSLESRNFRRGYTGIAPIPFIMWAGLHLKREKIDEYFEYDKIQTDKFYKLKKGGKYPQIQREKYLNQNDSNTNEIVIAVSITKRIALEQMKQFGDVKKVELYINEPKDNAIKYRSQLIEYAQEVAKTIEDISASASFKKIHLLISSQSSLALEIGKRVDDQRMAEIICYFFDIKQDKNYPWGITMNGENKGKIII